MKDYYEQRSSLITIEVSETPSRSTVEDQLFTDVNNKACQVINM